MPTITPTWAFDDSPIHDPHGRAARMLRFVDLLRHPATEGEDRRPIPHRWQRRIIERIYGPSDANGERLVRTVFMLLPRGARKTTLTAALALGHTIGPAQRPRGQVIVAASQRSQAREAFDEAAAMRAQDARLVEALTVTPGEIIEDEVIEARVRDLCERFDVRRIGFDPKFAGRIMGRLQEEGLPVEELAQKPVLLAPMYVEMQRAMIARRFRHGGAPVLRHAVLNAVPHTFDNGLFYLVKKKSGAAVDVAVACGMAVGLASEDAGEPSYFEAEDFDPQLLVLR